jgi:PASTA domain
MPQAFTFSLDSFQITDTRSLHNDTDYVTVTLLVTPQGGKGTPQVLTKSMGDVNNGDHPVNLSFPNIVVSPTDTVTFNYIIVNKGNAPSQFSGLLKTAGINLLTTLGVKGADEVGSLISVPNLGELGKTFIQFLAEQLVGVIFVNCDGPVAAEQVSYTFPALVAKTANGTFTHTTPHPGITSSKGCGGNSFYYVTWHMLDQSVVLAVPSIRVPDVIGGSDTSAAKAIRTAGLVPAPSGTGHVVLRQKPDAGTLVFKNSTVGYTLTKLPQK